MYPLNPNMLEIRPITDGISLLISIGIVLWLVKLFTSAPENIVLDMYMGSGTTGMACKYMNRSFIGIDNIKENVDLARFRINNVFELDKKIFNNIKPL